MELQQKDRALVELLQEKVGLFAEMTHFQVEEDGGSGVPLPTLPRGLFRSESLESPRGERLLQDAIREGEGASGEEPGLTSSPSHNRGHVARLCPSHSPELLRVPVGCRMPGMAGEDGPCCCLPPLILHSPGHFNDLFLVCGGGTETPLPVRGISLGACRSCALSERQPLPPPAEFRPSVLTSSLHTVEGLKDLLVGPGVELLLTPREPPLPMEPDSGGNTSPGVTASECQGRGPRQQVGGVKDNGVVPRSEWCQGAGGARPVRHLPLLNRW